jgi:hypothetical protein
MFLSSGTYNNHQKSSINLGFPLQLRYTEIVWSQTLQRPYDFCQKCDRIQD